MIAAGEKDDPPPSVKDAGELAALVMGPYRRSDLNDADVYVKHAIAAFLEFPASIGRKVAFDLPKTAKFLPTISELRDALREPTDRRRAVVDRARRVLAEHERREHEAKRFAKPPRDVRERIVASAKLLGAC